MPTQEQLACIFCGHSALLSRINLEKMDSWEIDWKVLQVREILPGPGRGHKGKGRIFGFPVIPSESLSIVEMAQNGSHPELLEAIKKRLTKIVRAYLAAGIIDPSDLFP